MHDLLLATYAAVLTIPVLALLAFGATSALDDRRRAHDAVAPAGSPPRRGNARLRSGVFVACLAFGTTASLLVSGALGFGATGLAGLAALAGVATGCAWRLTRPPHGAAPRAVANAIAWWGVFGLLAGLTAQVLVQGGLLSAAGLIALVAVAGAQALARDGRLARAGGSALGDRRG